MNRFDVCDRVDSGWQLGHRIIEACRLKSGNVKQALG